MSIRPEERQVLRELAQRVADIAARPEQKDKCRRWQDHNSLRGQRPMVLCYPEGSWVECIPPHTIQCKNPVLYGWEKRLRMQIFQHEHIHDDHIVDPYFNVSWDGKFIGWEGLEIKTDLPAGGTEWRMEDIYYVHPNMDMNLLCTKSRGAWHWTPPLQDYRDLDRLGHYIFEIDEAVSHQRAALARDLFGDILPVRIHGWMWVHAGIAPHAVRLRGMEQLMMDCLDNPTWVHQFSARLAAEVGAHLDRLEHGGYLSTNHESEWVGSGGIGCTNELPAPGFTPGQVRCADMWGVAETQDLVGYSPSMWEEFFMAYTYPILDRFGLNCFGCCEPLHDRIAGVRRIPRLRRVSISSWCDVEKAAEGFGRDVVLSYKPSPTLLATPHFDEAAIRARLLEDLRRFHQHGSHVEIIMKDLQSVQEQPDRITRFIRIVREVIDEVYA